jgi:hypothetical protein
LYSTLGLSTKTSSWHSKSGSFKQVYYNENGELWTLNSKNQIQKAKNINAKWVTIKNTNLKWIAKEGSHVWGTTLKNNILHLKKGGFRHVKKVVHGKHGKHVKKVVHRRHGKHGKHGKKHRHVKHVYSKTCSHGKLKLGSLVSSKVNAVNKKSGCKVCKVKSGKVAGYKYKLIYLAKSK